MITITLEVDQATDAAYHNLPPECKQQLNEDIRVLIRNSINNVRAIKIKKILDDIAKGENLSELDSDILTTLLRDND